MSLDRADNDPLQFWSYVISALDTLAPGVGTTALALLQSPQPPPIERILTSVLNGFSAAYAVPPVRDVALVLDDYHVITASAIHDALTLLLEHLPPQFHLVILTRADPALPLARLRARGTMTELHARGDHGTAQRTLETYIDLARQRGFVAHLIARGAAVQAQLALAQGDVAAAVAWANASSLHATDDIPFAREAEYLILARVWITQVGSESAASLQPQAMALLARLLADAEAKARWGSMLDILIVRALAQWAQEAHSDALATLERALTLAAPEGCIRRFVDAGPAMTKRRMQPKSAGLLRTISPGSSRPSRSQTRRPGDWENRKPGKPMPERSPCLPVSWSRGLWSSR